MDATELAESLRLGCFAADDSKPEELDSIRRSCKNLRASITASSAPRINQGFKITT